MSEVVCRLQTEVGGPVAEVRDSNFCALGRELDPSNPFDTNNILVLSDPGSRASIESELTGTPDGAVRFSFSGWSASTKLGFLDSLDYLEGSASVLFRQTFWLISEGPVRTGWLSAPRGYFANFAALDANGEMEVYIDGVPTIGGGRAFLDGPVLVDPLQVTLGRPISIVVEARSLYDGDPGRTGLAAGVQEIDLELRALEVDGTPVPLATPEPGSLALLGGGLVLLLARLRRRG